MAKRFIVVQTHKKTWRAGRIIEGCSATHEPPVYELLHVRFNNLNKAVQTIEDVENGELPVWEIGAVR